jgi:hypothetical protein
MCGQSPTDRETVSLSSGLCPFFIVFGHSPENKRQTACGMAKPIRTSGGIAAKKFSET